MEEIKIVGIIADAVGKPHNDGRRGSALYAVPLKLSSSTSSVWADIFVQVWDRPPEWTTAHRPGIARVVGDRVILDGTTIDEVERSHMKTLKLVVDETNKRAAEVERQCQRAAAREREEQRRHQDHVADVARRLKFD